MNSANIVKSFRNFCKNHYNQENIAKYGRYFKGGFKGYGLTTVQLREQVKKYKIDKNIQISTLLECAEQLIPSPYYEEPSFIMLLINEHRKEYTKSVFRKMEKWYKNGIYNWAHADTMGMFILPNFLEKGIVTPADFRPWIKAKNSYQRRSVPVTFIKYLKITENFSELFDITEPLMRDSMKEVQQGQGWFLREAWKKQPVLTEAFLLKWKDEAPRLIIQYACEKMDKEYKKKFAKRRSGNRE